MSNTAMKKRENKISYTVVLKKKKKLSHKIIPDPEAFWPVPSEDSIKLRHIQKY